MSSLCPGRDTATSKFDWRHLARRTRPAAGTVVSSSFSTTCRASRKINMTVSRPGHCRTEWSKPEFHCCLLAVYPRKPSISSRDQRGAFNRKEVTGKTSKISAKQIGERSRQLGDGQKQSSFPERINEGGCRR